MTAKFWEFILTENGQYMDITQLGEKYGLLTAAWAENPSVKSILNYLADRELDPDYIYEDRHFVRVELIETLLVQSFLTSRTPTVPQDIDKLLRDRAVADAQFHYGRECLQSDQTDAAHRLLKEAEERFATVSRVHGMTVLNRLWGTDKGRTVHTMVKELKKQVPTYGLEIADLVIAMKYELKILATKYRIALAQSMILEANRRCQQRAALTLGVAI